MLRALALPVSGLALLTVACGGDASPQIAPQWSDTRDVLMAPPAPGTDGRLVVAHRVAPGRWETLEATDGDNIEGPFDTLPTAHAPVMIGAEVFLVAQVSGRIVRYDLAGQELDMPTLALGNTGPLVAAPDGGLRVVANSGILAIVDAAYSDVVQANLPGVADSPPAVDADGTTYVATDVGRLLGISPSGERTFDVTVPAPASGVSLAPDRVAVGAIDAVKVFDRAGAEVFSRPRDARVVGTRWTADGDLLAWGEDGRLERLAPDGELRFSLEVGPPIRAEVRELPSGNLAVVDADGRVSLVSADGELLDQREIAPDETEAPLRQVAVGPAEQITVTRGRSLVALDLGFLP